jgi:hypothetical protein
MDVCRNSCRSNRNVCCADLRVVRTECTPWQEQHDQRQDKNGLEPVHSVFLQGHQAVANQDIARRIAKVSYSPIVGQIFG